MPEIREALRAYLTGSFPLGDLEDVLLQRTWAKRMSLDDWDLREVAERILLLIAEHSSGHRSDEEIRAEITRLSSAKLYNLYVSCDAFGTAMLSALGPLDFGATNTDLTPTSVALGTGFEAAFA